MAPEHVRTAMRLFLACHREGRDPREEELHALLRDAQPAPSVEGLLQACHEGGEALWEAAVAEAGPPEQAELVDLARGLLHWQGRLARTLVRDAPRLDREPQAARRALAGALLGAAAAPAVEERGIAGLAERAGVRLPERAEVLAYRLQDGAGLPPDIAAVRHALEEAAGEPVLSEEDAVEGAVLLPAGDGAAERAVAALGRALGRPVTGGAAIAEGVGAIAAAAARAREVRDLAVALGRAPGVHRARQLLVELALSASPERLEELGRLLDPLARRPNLLATLEAWFAHDFDRRATAEALSIHRNTLDYRLRRVGDLTGLALDSARGLQAAGAALVSRRLRASGKPTAGRLTGS